MTASCEKMADVTSAAGEPSATPETMGARERLATPEIQQLVERVVRKRVPQSEVADMVQTVLLHALAAKAPPEEQEQLRKWVVGIARHKIADHYRQKNKAQPVELRDDIEAQSGPLSAREWARWAQKQTDGDEEAKRTLGWMAREGAGEKLAHIAKDEQLPAAQVRQRVSRLRRLMKSRWATELAAVAAVLLAVLVAWSQGGTLLVRPHLAVALVMSSTSRWTAASNGPSDSARSSWSSSGGASNRGK